MKKRLIILISSIFLLGLVGCAGKGNNNAADIRNNDNQTKVRTNSVNDNNRNKNNQGLRVSNKAARSVERMSQVDRAHVIISNNNAYVAVRMANGNNRNVNNNNQDNRNKSGNAEKSYTIGTDQDDMIIGDGSGRYRADENGKVIPSPNGNKDRNGAIGGNANKNANGNNGTVGNNFGNGGNAGKDSTGGTNYSRVSSPLEQQIADQVRKSDKRIHRVYISFDNNFYNRMGTYANNISGGQNQDGVFQDFNNYVRGWFTR